MPRDHRLANILLAVYMAVALLALSLPAGPWVEASKRTLAYLMMPGAVSGRAVLGALGNVPSRWGALVRADLDNRELREQLKDSGILQTEAKTILEENARLREALSLKTRLPWRFKAARVVERDPVSWFSSVIVDKGEAEGLKPGDAVFALAAGRLALAGRLVETSTDTARVLLLTDELSSVAAIVAPAAWQGLVEGQGHKRLRMNYIPMEALPRVGQEVLTSPVSLMFTPGVWIGNVARVLESDPHLPYRVLEVYPAVHPAKLDFVLIKEGKR